MVECSDDPASRDKIIEFPSGRGRKLLLLDAAPVSRAPKPVFGTSNVSTSSAEVAGRGKVSASSLQTHSSISLDLFARTVEAARLASACVLDTEVSISSPADETTNVTENLRELARGAAGPAWASPNGVAEYFNDFRKNIHVLDDPLNVATNVNVAFVFALVCGRPAIFVIVVRPVKTGDWLRLDYGAGMYACILRSPSFSPLTNDPG
jgi:hypothetical protein